MNKRIITAGIIGMLLVVGGAFYFLNQDDSQVLSGNVFRDEDSGIGFTYSELELSDNPQTEDAFSSNINTIAQLGTTDEEESPVLITIREESRFRIVSNTVGKPALEIVRDNLLSNYPDRYPGFELISNEETQVDNLPAIDIVFTYTNSGQTLQQQFIAVQKTDDVMVYLTFQSLAEDYAELQERQLKPILDSIDI